MLTSKAVWGWGDLRAGGAGFFRTPVLEGHEYSGSVLFQVGLDFYYLLPNLG